MITLRAASDRGHANHGWLDTNHTFSFAHYYDPKHMGFGALRVINDDRVVAGAGFPTHPHRDMEILSYVVEGALEHRDSMGNGSVIRPGEVQRMSAGTGVTHSEFNPSRDEDLRFLQIWVVPDARGLEPGYEQRHFGDERRGRLRLVASRDGREGSVTLHQDVDVHASLLDPGERVEHRLDEGRRAWVQVVRGELRIDDRVLREGDGAALEGVERIGVEAITDAELLLFDLI
ncbi:MAG: pirin family protein [Deltaproteobacteria bacterium]|nr:pirin family protein [Deltaproteobacteria bacterium]